jgi:hypothetical protein
VTARLCLGIRVQAEPGHERLNKRAVEPRLSLQGAGSEEAIFVSDRDCFAALAMTQQRCFLKPSPDLLDIQPIPIPIAHELPRRGTGEMGANNQRGRTRVFIEYPATGGDGGGVVYVKRGN